MRLLKFIMILGLVLFGFQSCETYDDMDVEYSPIFPLSGEWYVNIYDAATGQMIPDGDGYSCNTYNTSANDADKMWVKLSTAAAPFGVVGKVNCDPQTNTFSIENGVNTLSTVNSGFTLSEGTVVLNGYDTPTGGKADAIQFKLKTDKSAMTYLIKGFRKTGWEDDEE